MDNKTNKRLIHVNKISTFNTLKLSTNSENTEYCVGSNNNVIYTGSGDIDYQSMVFIHETNQIWTHGKYFGGQIAISDIIDSLESIDNEKVLSANQGFILKGYIDTLETLLELNNSEDIQSYKIIKLIFSSNLAINITNIRLIDDQSDNIASLSDTTITSDMDNSWETSKSFGWIKFSRTEEFIPVDLYITSINSISNVTILGSNDDIDFEIIKEFSFSDTDWTSGEEKNLEFDTPETKDAIKRIDNVIDFIEKYYGTKEDINNINYTKQDKIKQINKEATDNNITIEPNILYVWDEVESLTINLSTNIEAGIVNEFLFSFKSGDTATTLSLPSDILWLYDPVIRPNRSYQISIINNYGIIGEFA